jgi:hypothetical protein
MSLTKVSYSMIEGAYINVRDYGAVGDGVTDDSAAIQAAMNAVPQWTNVSTTPVPGNSQSVGGGVLYFPPTSAGYRIATAINVTKTVVKIIGPARLYIDPGVTGFLFNYVGASAKTGVVFERLDFTGGSYGVNTGDQNVWAPASFYNCTFVNQTDAGIRIGAYGFSYAIRDCLFTGCKHGIYTVGSASDNLLIDHCMFIYNSNYDIYISENNTITIRSCDFVGNQFTPAADAANIFISMDSSTETAGYSSIIGNKFGQEGRTAGYCIYVTGTSAARLTALVVRDNLMHFESSTAIGHGIKLNNVNAYGLVVENNSLTYCQLIDYSTSSTTERNGENVIGENTVVTGESWSQLLRGNYNILDHIEPPTFNKYNLLKWSRYINSGADFTYTNATPSYMTATDENGVANNATTVVATAVNNIIRYNALDTNNQQKFYSLSVWMKLDTAGSVAFVINRAGNYVLSRSVNVGTDWQRVTIEFYQTYLGAGFPYTWDLTIPNGSTITLGGACLVAGRDVGDLRRSDTTIEFPGGRIQAAASPVAGINWRVGDIAYENTPVVGQPIGWMCTVAGNPGTWVALASL